MYFQALRRFAQQIFCVAAVAGVLSAQTPRCGHERWSIKTGTDSQAAAINLTNPVVTTLAAIAAPTPPNPIPADTRVAPAETTVWTLQATLTAFKIEDGPTGDSDYHLAIMDEHGATLIVEIPHPGCVAAGSPFLPGVTASRKTFDGRFQPTGQFQMVSVPIQVTGVGMYDFSHGQRGYAANGIELHPVLDIRFLDKAPVTNPPVTGGGTTPPPPVTTTQLLLDPSFEMGTTGSPWTASKSVLNGSATEPAHTGTWKAWLHGVSRTKKDTLSQTVTIPANAKSATLTFWLQIVTAETGTKPNDTLSITVRDDKGVEVPIDDEEGDPWSNVDAMPYTKHTFDMKRFIGRKVTITFTAQGNGSLPTSFLVDDVQLNVR